MCLRASGHCSLRSVIAATFRNLVPKLKHSCSLCTSCCVTFPPGYLCISKQSIKAEVLSKSYAVWALFCSWKDYFCLNVSRFSSSVKLLYSETKFYSYNQTLLTSRWRKQSLYRKRVILVQTRPLLEGYTVPIPVPPSFEKSLMDPALSRSPLQNWYLIEINLWKRCTLSKATLLPTAAFTQCLVQVGIWIPDSSPELGTTSQGNHRLRIPWGFGWGFVGTAL